MNTVLKRNFIKYRYRDEKLKIKQIFDLFFVLDFEATCDQPVQISPMEIIEFPVLKVNATTFNIESTFHEFIKPTINPNITLFCTQLTGITSEMLNASKSFPIVHNQFERWLVNELQQSSLELNKLDLKYSFVTFGDWDLKKMLPEQCALANVKQLECFNNWINLKKSIVHATNVWPKGLENTLNKFNLTRIGRLHSGLDDCKNILQLMKYLALEKNFLFNYTSSTI